MKSARVAVFVPLSAVPAFAQTDGARISGRSTDPTSSLDWHNS